MFIAYMMRDFLAHSVEFSNRNVIKELHITSNHRTHFWQICISDFFFHDLLLIKETYMVVCGEGRHLTTNVKLKPF